MTLSPGAVPGSAQAGTSTLAVAPAAPGRLGEPLGVEAARTYLLDLGRWRDARKRELELLDAAALRSADPPAYTPDVTLSMSLWQAVDDRYQQMLKVWDDGRADVLARDRLAQLVWGRLESGGLGVSLVEATRLSDALAAQLRARLSLDPRAAESGARVTALRAALERLRELVKQEPGWAPQVETLATRIDDVASRAARGADVDPVLTELEADAARAERDLVVTTARRRNQARAAERAAAALVTDRTRAENEVLALSRREEEARALVARTVGVVADAPRLAVPDVEALGPVPEDRQALDAYLRRLDEVARALQLVERAYGDALAEREELIGLFGGYATRAARTGRSTEPAVARAGALARSALESAPVRLAEARVLVARYVELVRAAASSSTPAPMSASIPETPQTTPPGAPS
jgi:hypothetical protein